MTKRSEILPERSHFGKCDWCPSETQLHYHELPDGDEVHICSVCWWLQKLQSEVKDACGVGDDLA